MKSNNTKDRQHIIKVEVDGITYEMQSGETLHALTEYDDVNIAFACFSGRCGLCKVQVLVGGENLNTPTDLEELFFVDSSEAANERLACQCTPHGFVSIVSQ